LGNASNRYLFSQSFWRDEEEGLSTYLNHASGVPQIVSEPQGGNQPPLKRNRKIIDREHPPANAQEAQKRWQAARENFGRKLQSSQQIQLELQAVHKQLNRLARITAKIAEISEKLRQLKNDIRQLEIRECEERKRHQHSEEVWDDALRAQEAHFLTRPGFFARLFQTKAFRAWKFEHLSLSSKVRETAQIVAGHKEVCDKLNAQLSERSLLIEQLEQNCNTRETEKGTLEASLRRIQSQMDVPIPDDTFFSKPREEIQISNVWFDNAANRARDELFEAAILLHRAFIDAAANVLRQNLSIFVEAFGTRPLGTPQKDALIKDLWASFFLVVPVVSTTFASVNRMFSKLPPETLGWLLIDEAGQAVPQAAIGAIMRAKRSVVVGDPLQIEPVVTMPNTLTEEICAYFGIDPLKYNAPEASVQTVADAASKYCARFNIGSGFRDVGAPLLVHRRCDSPMFDISNEIAYSNLMVQAKKPSSKQTVLGPSSWIDVVGKPGPDKWCADEAVVLLKMLEKLKASGEKPDFYVVTPFVVVQDNLRQEILKSGVLQGWTDNPNAWVWEHVGTVHTVQGREADTVFFVLGAQASSQKGARAWAGGKPNLVNVAITRSKRSLYVIGNRSLWSSAGVFSALDRYLPDGKDQDKS
jgi:superfamily I DNA and/or RNA helicase